MRWWVWVAFAVLLLAVFIAWRVLKTAGSMQAVQGLEEAAVAYMEHGRYNEAEALLRDALKAAEADMSEGNIAPVQINLARALAGQHQLDEAESYARKALEIFKRTHGPTNTLVAYSLKLLAEINEAKGNSSEAKAYLSEAADVLRSEETNPELGNTGMREALRKAIEHADSKIGISPDRAN
jgi:tetratricopeptide (TPR) repeat protein